VIETALRELLETNAGVQAIAAGRVWPLKLPQSAELPALVYQRISTPDPPLGLEGEVGPSRPRFQVSSWAATDGVARQLGAAVRTALHGHSGVIAGEPIRLMRVANSLDGYEPGPPERFRVITDVVVYTMEGVAA
jgi:hypothetical protein